MRKPLRSIFRLIASIIVFAQVPVFDSLAQSYPIKPIRMLVGFSPGGGTDIAARIIAQKLSEQFGQQVLVDNRAGGGGTIATARTATSSPDGYTLLMMVVTAETVPPLENEKRPYDLVRDLAPVSLVSVASNVVVVHPSVRASSTKELIALLRSQPGKLNYGSSGAGSTMYLAGELFKSMANVNIVQVPYKGASDAIVANVAGEVEITFPAIIGALPLIKIDKLRAIAVTSEKRASLMPSLPTLNESGLPGYNFSTRWGVVAPAGVKNDIISRLHSEIVKAISGPEVKESFAKQGMEPQTNTPEEFAALIRQEIAQNLRLIKLTQ